MGAINDFFRVILDWIQSFVGNYGWSIILFTLLIRFVLMPLEIKSRKGMRQMSKMQPKIAALQKKYEKDKDKLQRKQAELFKNEHYNPLSGCLPMLIQWPILLAMFAAMRSMANEKMVEQVLFFLNGQTPLYDGFFWIKNVWVTDSPFSAVAPDVTQLNANLIDYKTWQTAIQNLMTTNPTLIESIKSQYTFIDDIMALTSNTDFTNTIQPAVVSALQTMPAYQSALATVDGWGNLNFFVVTLRLYQQYNGLLILPVLAIVSQYLMQKLQPMQAAAGADPQQQGSTKMMMWFMYAMTLFFCLSSNACFALYWVASNLIATAQTFGINKYLDQKEAKALAASQTSGEGTIK